MSSESQAPVQMESSWKELLAHEFKKEYMTSLKSFLKEEYKKGRTIYPQKSKYFEAFNRTPFSQVKVVILGQDPYHGPGQAHGLCFSVGLDVPPPPSLKNIFKELREDLGILPPNHGYLASWADQGVLLLNSVLTVERKKPASHQKRGWERFTDEVIRLLNEKKEHVVFLLWGSYAQEKGKQVDETKHLVLKTSHPSPFSADRGFLGSSCFSKTNEYLNSHKKGAIDWSLPKKEAIKW